MTKWKEREEEKKKKEKKKPRQEKGREGVGIRCLVTLKTIIKDKGYFYGPIPII
jgi:hypothetical protein